MRLLVAAMLSLCALAGCAEPPDEPTVPCEPGRTDEFALGVVIFESPRWFRAFDEGCDTVEMETGLQGGWHIEPAIQAPRSASNADLGGRILWSVRDEDDTTVANAEFELYRSFWQTLEGGDAYWGDFVIFIRNPANLVGTQITIECRLEFDELSSLDDVTLTRAVTFVDEKPNTEFE